MAAHWSAVGQRLLVLGWLLAGPSFLSHRPRSSASPGADVRSRLERHCRIAAESAARTGWTLVHRAHDRARTADARLGPTHDLVEATRCLALGFSAEGP